MFKRFAGLTCAIGVVLLTAACAKSDAGITTAVKSRMAADDTVKAYQVNVDTKDRVVTLTGEVPSTAAKEQAVQIARSTDGVASVVDNLTVAAAAAGTGFGDSAAATAGRIGDAASDAMITSALKTKFLADPDVAGLKIDIDTSAGVVTLIGTVKTQIEKDEALRIARETDGVKNVVDRLTIGR
ncbi:MAG: BON domain-containing protein [Vicinamibacterales bacterium]